LRHGEGVAVCRFCLFKFYDQGANFMKRVLIIAILSVLAGISAFDADAFPARAAAPHMTAGQIRIDNILGRKHHHHKHNNNNYNNVRYETSIVHKGNKTYRDTYRITWKNGKEKTKRISHVRIG
jgi:hypothetical protein